MATTMGYNCTTPRWGHLFEYWVTAMQRLRNWQKPFATAFDSTALDSINCDDSTEVQELSETDTTPDTHLDRPPTQA